MRAGMRTLSRARERQIRPVAFEAQLRQFLPLGGVVALILLLILPFLLVDLLGRSFELTFFTGLLIYSMLALSLDLIWGYGGIISLAQGTFFGVGGYALGYGLVRVGGWQGALIGASVGIPLAALAGLILGLVSFRARVGGLYFAIITLALALLAQLAATTLYSITGGDNGIYGIPGLAGIGSHGDLIQYYAILAATLLAFFLAWVFVNSHFGRVLTAARENELRATSIGFDVNVAKAITFSVSAGLAAAAGCLFATYNGIVNPDLVGFATGANVLIWLAIGGRGFLLGAVLGTLLLNYMQFKMTSLVAVFLGSKAISVWPAFFGVVFLLVVLIFPHGLTGQLARLGKIRVRVKRKFPIPWVRWAPIRGVQDPLETAPHHGGVGGA
jgi:ABC-type branched-subunit amino acid transport system permease subunit